jgi:PAS domain S-box-containing protein
MQLFDARPAIVQALRKPFRRQNFWELHFMKYKLQDLVNLEEFQYLQDRLNDINPFPSAIIDLEGNILTATAWQDICLLFHRKNPQCEYDCRKSDQYIVSHLRDANPAVSYECPRGLVDNAIPIMIDGIHYANFFTGQFFLKEPDLEFYKEQAKRFGFDKAAYLESVSKVPIWSKEQLNSYLLFIKGLIDVIAATGAKRLHEIESGRKIAESEMRLKTVIQKMLDGFWVIELDTVRILDVNDAMCNMLGYTRDEMLAASLTDFLADETPEQSMQRIAQIIEAGSSFFESRFRRKDGAILDLDVSVTLLTEQKLFFGFHHDNTARKAAENALKASDFRYRILYEQNPDGVLILDPVDTRPIEFNDQVCRQLGYTRDEFAQLTLQQIDVKESYEESLAHIQEIIRKGSDDFETQHRTKTGEIRDVRVIVQIVQFGGQSVYHCIWRDITEQKRAHEIIIKSEEKFSKAFRASPEAFTITSMNDGRYIEVNDAFLKKTGYTREEVLNHTTIELGIWVDLNDRHRFIEELRAHGFLKDFETRYRMRDGDIRDVLISSEVIDVENEQCSLNFIFDVTERKRSEARILAALAEKETLLRELYHRTKNNMSVINAILGLQANSIGDERLQSAFEEAQNRIRSMALVHQKLYEASDLSHINLRDYIDDLVALILESYSLASENITFHFQLSDVYILIDTAIPCGLILNELVTNALKYAFPADQAGEIEIKLQRLEGGEIELSVSDNGVGFPPGFDPRQNGKMGLRTVFTLAEEQLLGSCSLTSDQGVHCRLVFSDNLYQPRV